METLELNRSNSKLCDSKTYLISTNLLQTYVSIHEMVQFRMPLIDFQAFSDGCVGDWGGGDYRDLMSGLEHALGGEVCMRSTRFRLRYIVSKSTPVCDTQSTLCVVDCLPQRMIGLIRTD